MAQNETPGAAQLVELSELADPPSGGPAVMASNMNVLNGVKVTLNVVVGEAHTTLGELMNLKELAVLKIDRLADSPIDVLVDGNVIARGQLVVVDDNFGVRITEIAAAAK